MKRLSFIVLTSLICLLLSLSACTAPAPAPSVPLPTPTAALEPAPSATRVVTIKELPYNQLSPADLPREETLMLNGWESTNPRDYDPATGSDSDLRLIFSGLVSFDPQLNLIPDLAETWQVSPDGTVYTFTLRANAVFQNGKPLTTRDVIYSWERAADPRTESDMVLTYLGDIVGLHDKFEGKADSISGLKALDERTLQVTIDAPKPYFLQKLTFPTAFVVDQQNVESGEEWYRRPNGSGPYRVAGWKHLEYTLFERNELFYLQKPAIPYILSNISGSGLLSYESGEADIVGVGLYNLARVNDPREPLHAELVGGVNLCTGYVTFDINQPPFDDLKVRQAFTMAFDRQKYIEVVLKNSNLPAVGVYPPALPGYNPNLKTLPYDPEAARKLLAESKYGGAGQMPTLTFTQGGTGYYVDLGAAAMIQMWQQNLGVTINVESIDSNEYYDEISAGHHGQFVDNGWCADYPDPENFADVLFHSSSEYNRGHYNNPDLDRLLEQARVEPDVNKRIQMYQQAEQMIVNDAPVLFTSHSTSHVLVKPYVKGYVITPMTVSIERYLSLDASLMP